MHTPMCWAAAALTCRAALALTCAPPCTVCNARELAALAAPATTPAEAPTAEPTVSAAVWMAPAAACGGEEQGGARVRSAGHHGGCSAGTPRRPAHPIPQTAAAPRLVALGNRVLYRLGVCRGLGSRLGRRAQAAAAGRGRRGGGWRLGVRGHHSKQGVQYTLHKA